MLEKLLECMARWEGFYVPGSVANRLNNPGNLIYMRHLSAFAEPHVITGKDGVKRTYAKFLSVTIGWERMRELIKTIARVHSDLTVSTFITGQRIDGKVIADEYPGYAPAVDDNDTERYIRFICEKCEIKPDTLLRDVVG